MRGLNPLLQGAESPLSAELQRLSTPLDPALQGKAPAFSNC